jgi:hypothetical protein
MGNLEGSWGWGSRKAAADAVTTGGIANADKGHGGTRTVHQFSLLSEFSKHVSFTRPLQEVIYTLDRVSISSINTEPHLRLPQQTASAS